ncbi:hypothetical protein BDZ89DRAFT_1138105 [Hymenopellis radicata]|nr:hypothetical protein BDZ89DRAFT_1138105 [Hymenopellis radicata]
MAFNFKSLVFTFVYGASAACTETYTVVSGDDCTLIPQKASISTYQLTFLNSGLNCNRSISMRSRFHIGTPPSWDDLL